MIQAEAPDFRCAPKGASKETGDFCFFVHRRFLREEAVKHREVAPCHFLTDVAFAHREEADPKLKDRSNERKRYSLWQCFNKGYTLPEFSRKCKAFSAPKRQKLLYNILSVVIDTDSK